MVATAPNEYNIREPNLTGSSGATLSYPPPPRTSDHLAAACDWEIQSRGSLPYAAAYLECLDTATCAATLSDLPTQWEEASGSILIHNDSLTLVFRPSEAERRPRQYGKGYNTVWARTACIPKNLSVYYYEVTVIDVGPPPEHLGAPLLLGFESSKGSSLAWYSDTGELHNTKGSASTVLRSMPTFTASDVIGCGTILTPLTCCIFFTKNGELLDGVPFDPETFLRGVEQIRPAVNMPLGRDHTTVLRSNLGHTPFVFDIVKYCREHVARNPATLATFPEDILDEVLMQAIAIFNAVGSFEKTFGGKDREAIQHYALVCRRWHRLCLPYLMHTMRFEHIHTMAKISPSSLGFVQDLSIVELPGPNGDLWFHCLAVSPLSQQLKFLKRLERIFPGLYQWEQSYERQLPPRISDALPNLIRSRFANLISLDLHNCRFGSWVAFAKSILSFPCLRSLEMQRVGWDEDGVQAPPRWLRSYGKPLRIASPDMTSWYGLAWLLLVPRKVSRSVDAVPLTLCTQDIRAVALVFRVLCTGKLISTPNQIVLEQEQDKYVIKFTGTSYPDTFDIARLTFSAVTKTMHVLDSISIRLDDFSMSDEHKFEELSRRLREITSRDTCMCKLHGSWSYPPTMKKVRKAMAAQAQRELLEFYSSKRPWLFDSDTKLDMPTMESSERSDGEDSA